jgi:hypothetical protein
MEFSMRNQISYAVLGLALVAGASAASAQTLNTQEPLVVMPPPAVGVAQTVETVPVETVETVRTVRPAGERRTVSRRVARSRTGNVVTTTTRRTFVRERVIPAEAALAPSYPQPLYDVAMPTPAINPPPMFAQPVASAPIVVPAYRYVYEPDRILVIDSNTNIAVQAIPR